MSRFAPRLFLLCAALSACAEREGPGLFPDDAGAALPADGGGGLPDGGRRRDGGARSDGGASGDAGIGPPVLPPEVIVVEVRSFSPARGPAAGGTEITLEGRGFVPGTTVTVGGVALVDKQIEAERVIRGRTPPGSPGVVPVIVENRAARVEVPGGFTYFEAVTLGDVLPARGPAGGGTVVAITGTGIVPGSMLLVGTRPAFDVRVESPSRLTAVTPPGVPGPASVSIVNHNGSATRAGGFTYVADVALTAVQPAAGPLAGGNFVRILGRGFDAGAQVFFGSARALAVTVRDETDISARAPGASAPGAVDVSVLAEGGAAVLPRAYAYYGEGGALAVQGVVPARGPVTGGTSITVVGAGFDAGVTEVRVGGAAATAVAARGSGVLTAVTPAGTPGPADVTVVTGAGEATLAGGFTYESPLRIAQVEPASGPAAGGTDVRLRGDGFAAGAELFFGPVAATSVEIEDATTLRVRTPPGAAGPVDVRVRQAGREAVLAGGFTYYDEARILRVEPDRGAIAGGTLVTLSGVGFTPGSRPFFDGAPAVEVTFVDAATLTARTPPGAVGPADLVVLGGQGAAVLQAGYTYFDPTSVYGGTSGGRVIGAVNVSVLDGATGDRLSGAFATLAVSGTTLYQGITDRNGQVVFSGPDLSGRQVATAAKEGYSASTVVAFDAENVTVFLSPLSVSFGVGPGPELGIIRGVVKSAFKGIPPPPEGFIKAVLVTSTMADRFTPNPQAQGVVAVLTDTTAEDAPYEIFTRNGDLAVYALAGHLNAEGTVFVPFQMGIHRYVFVPDGGFLEGVDVTMDAALNATLDARLLTPPPLDPEGPTAYRMRVFLELGIDGVVTFFQIPESTLEPRVVQEHLPVVGGSIAGSTYTVVAGAYNVFDGQEYSPLSVYTKKGIVDLQGPVEIGPFMGLATPIRPGDAEYLDGNRFAFGLVDPPTPSFSLLYVLRPSGLGFTSIWEVILPAEVREVQVPDLPSLAGLVGLPPNEVLYWVVIPVLGPPFAIDAFDYRAFDTRGWTTYSIAPFVFLTR